jgi:tetratricopeptide (TPR) repeat protein
MKLTYSLGVCFLAVFSACAGFQVGTEFASGRQALIEGKYENALGHFQVAAQRDPDYVYGGVLRQGVWSYVGRTQYLIGQYPQAQKTLEQALNQPKNNDLANLYLGLTLMRIGDRQKGLEDIGIGMKGIAQFINYVTETFRYNIGAFWDPGYSIRNAIQRTLTMTARDPIDWQQLIADGEWIGINFEREPDRANAQQIQDLQSQRR